MMNIVPYEPWSLLRRFDEMGRNLGRGGFGNLQTDEGDSSNVVTSHWLPAVDIKEETDKFVLTADVPGVDPKDIDITMENGVLTIKGERKLENEQARDGYSRVERIYGSFYRRFSLPDTADAEGISAKGRNGVLEVVIPKRETSKPRRITVQA